jgi:hypothetical protein
MDVEVFLQFLALRAMPIFIPDVHQHLVCDFSLKSHRRGRADAFGLIIGF